MTSFVRVVIVLLSTALVSCGEQTSSQGEKKGTATVIPRAADTVNAPRMVKAGLDGSLLLSAETGKGEGPAIKYMPEWRAFGWFTSADSVIWDVEIENGGDYEVSMEWSVDDGEAGKEFVLKTNSDELTGTVDKSGSWETFKTKNIGTINLQTGQEKIVFKSKNEFGKDSALLDLRNLKLVKKM